MEDVNSGDFGVYESFLLNFIDESHCIIAETIRLVDFLPNDFRQPALSRFKPLLLNFDYFAKTAECEKILESFEELQDSFYLSFRPVLKKFEVLFQAAATLIQDFIEFSNEVTQGNGITALIDISKELEVEATASIATVIFHLDRLFDGPTRERVFVAIYRESENRNNIDFLADLLRQSVKSELALMETSMIHRVKINSSFVDSTLTFFERVCKQRKENSLQRLRSRLPEMAFCCLSFSRPTREKNSHRMKLFVDNFFRDSWIISLGVGLSISVYDEWYNCVAARNALNSVISTDRAREIAKENMKLLLAREFSASDVKPENFEIIIEHINHTNLALKWILLHTDSSLNRFNPRYAPSLSEFQKMVDEKGLDIVLRIATFEMDFLDNYSKYLATKEVTICALRDEICAILLEIADVFGKGISSIKVERKAKLCEWITLIRKTILELDIKSPENRTLVLDIRKRLDEVRKTLDLNSNVAMAHFLETLNGKLESLSAGLSITEEGEIRVKEAADSPYLWSLLDQWNARIQERVLQSTRSQPVRVIFHKLALSIDSPRNILKSNVKQGLRAKALSCYLERRLRNILQSIPNHVFSLLKQKVVPLLKRDFGNFLDKAMVKDFAEFPDILKLSEVTFAISNMSLGISRLAIRKIGTVEVNPKELLEDGVHRELSCELPVLLAVADNKDKDLEIGALISKFSSHTSSFYKGFIYICEHLSLDGHEIWRDEMDNYVEKIRDSYDVPIPKKITKPLSVFSIVFQILLNSSSPTTTYYVPSQMVWKDNRYSKTKLSMRETDMIEDWIPFFIASSYEETVCRKVAKAIDKVVSALRALSSVTSCATLSEEFLQSKQMTALTNEVYYKHYDLAVDIASIGQMVLLRSLILISKRNSSRLRAPKLYLAVEKANRALLENIASLPPEVVDLCTLSRRLGIMNNKIMVKTGSSHFAPTYLLSLFGVICSSSSRLRENKRDICSHMFSVGLLTILENFNQTKGFADLCQQYSSFLRTASKPRVLVENSVFEKMSSFIPFHSGFSSCVSVL